MILSLLSADGGMMVGLWKLSSLDGCRPPWYQPQDPAHTGKILQDANFDYKMVTSCVMSVLCKRETGNESGGGSTSYTGKNLFYLDLHWYCFLSLLLLHSMWWLHWLDPLSCECHMLGCQEQILCRPPELGFEGHTSGPYLLPCLVVEWAGLQAMFWCLVRFSALR